MGYGLVRQDIDPVVAYDVLRQALRIGQDSGNRQLESHAAANLANLAALHGDPTDAFDFFTLAIRNYRDSGSFSHLHTPLGRLAAFFDRIGYHEPAATIAGLTARLLRASHFPQVGTTITHLREVLGDQTYESLARAGENMTNAEMASYALDKIDLARSHLRQAEEPR